MKVRLKILLDKPRGGAWPPTARAVKCPVKSGNERDPHHQLLLPTPVGRHTDGTAPDKGEEGVGDGRSVCPKCPGLHASCNGQDNEMQLRKEEQIP